MDSKRSRRRSLPNAWLLGALVIAAVPAPAATPLFDPQALHRQLRDHAHRLAQRFAPQRLPSPPAWARRTDPPLASVAVLADPHYDDSGKAPWTQPTRARLRKVVRYLNDSVRPQAVFLLGDLVAFEDAEQLRRVKALLDAELKPPYHPVPGNHDGPGYDDVFGPRNYSRAVAGLRFVVIGIDYAHWDSGWGTYGRLEWLGEQLAAHRAEPTLVLSHNPVVVPTFVNNAAVLQLVEGQAQVLGVLAGHLHEDYQMQLTKTHLGLPMLIRPPHAFKTLRLYPDRILIFTHEEREGAYQQANIYQKIDIPPAYRLKRPAEGRGEGTEPR